MYAFAIMRNRAAAQHRERQTMPVSLETIGPRRPPAPTPMPNERRLAVRRCLETLAPRDRLLVELVYLESVDPSVIAERLGIQPRSVERAAQRASNRIRPCLEGILSV